MSISLINQMHVYKELMNSLIYEKPSMTNERKAQKTEALSKLAREKLVINGNADFKNEVDGCINEILALKPGRKLIKAIVKHHPSQKIQITPSELSAFNEKDLEITLSLNPQKYTTLGGQASTRPAFVTLAHELIHALHFLKNSDDFFIRICIKDEIVALMDDLEEQRTILGFDNLLFSKECAKSKLDILCENAFLLALGLPPRIDHYNADYKPIAKDLDHNLDSYFEWMENALSLVSPIPKERADDKDFFLRYIRINPSAAHTLPEKLKNDEEFLLELMRSDKRLLKQFPELSQSKDFMLKLINLNEYAVFSIDAALLKEKEFVLKCLNLVAHEQGLIETIYNKLEKPLQEDSDLLHYFSIRAL